MDERYETRDEDAGEITFRGIGRFIKRSFLRVVIYIAAIVVLTTLVVVPLKLFWRSAPTATTRLEFVYEGINQGLDPSGALFDKDSIRSSAVVSSAVAQANLSSKLSDIEAVRNALRVTSVYSEDYLLLKERADKGDAEAVKQLASTSYYPTQYDVSLTDLKGLGLSKQESVCLVESVVKVYKEWFASRYTQRNIYSTSIFRESATSDGNMDYLGFYDLYTGQLESMRAYVQQMAEKDSSFRSSVSNKTFSDLLQMYQALDSAYGTYKSYIVSNKVSKNLTVTQNNISTTVDRYTNRKKSLEDTITKIQAQIAAYQPNTTTTTANGTTTIIQTYQPEYYRLQQQLTDCILELGTVTDELAEYSSRAKAFEGAAELPEGSPLITGADNMLARLRTDSIAFVTAVNGTVEDYFDSKLLTNSIRVIQPAVYVRSAIDVPVLYIYIVVVVVAVIAGLIVTHVKITRGREAAKTEPEAPAA